MGPGGRGRHAALSLGPDRAHQGHLAIDNRDLDGLRIEEPGVTKGVVNVIDQGFGLWAGLTVLTG
jgi:hypothetical protein